jgi:hypothetical protein
MTKLIRNARFWLILYLVIQAVLFYVYSFPVIRDFQRLYSSIFIVAMLAASIFTPKKFLIYVVILSAVFIDPLYTHTVFVLHFWYRIIVTTVFILLIIYKRNELSFMVKTLLVANVCLFIVQQWQIKRIDRNFRQQSYITNEKNPLQLQVDLTIPTGQNIYVILLDGYPSFNILRDSFQYHPKLKDYLLEHQFEMQPTFTIYKSTPLSLLNIFSSRKIKSEAYPAYLESNRDFLASALYNSALAKTLEAGHYKFSIFTSLLDKRSFAPLPFLPQYSINNFVAFMYKIIKGEKLQRFNYNIIPAYTAIMNGHLSQALSDTAKKMYVFHYNTFHNNIQTMIEEAKYADQVGIDAVNEILKRDTRATIIVMSDHGERRHLKNIEFMLQGIYTIRKGY